MENELQVIREQEIEACLIELREQKVLLDRDGNAVRSRNEAGE